MYESSDEVLLEADDKMTKSLDVLKNNLSGLRTGKASPSLVENIAVEAYGTQTRLRDISLISTPETRLIVIKPFDPSTLGAIEKGILAANIGITPLNDGRVVRVPIPELSEERRREMVKVASKYAEEAKVSVRAVRREANDAVKALERDGTITEDDLTKALEEIQEYTDGYVKKIDEAVAAREKEIMGV